MSRKIAIFLSFLVLLVLTGNAGAIPNRIYWWTDGEPDNRKWEEPNNWVTDDPCGTGYGHSYPNRWDPAGDDYTCQAIIPAQSGHGYTPDYGSVLIDANSPTDCAAYIFQVCCYDIGPGPYTYGQLDMTGGVANAFDLTSGHASSDVNVCIGTVNLSGGTITVHGDWDVTRLNNRCTYNVTGGEINFQFPEGSTGQGVNMCPGSVQKHNGIGRINIHGGTVKIPNLSLKLTLGLNVVDDGYDIYNNEPPAYGRGYIDITTGELWILGDYRDYIMARVYEPNHWITAYGSHQTINVEYFPDYLGSDRGATKVTATDPCNAHYPDPSQGEDYVSLDKVCSWAPGVLADKQNIYFGTSESDVNESGTPVATDVSVDTNTFDPFDDNDMEIGVKYYWRIESVNSVTEANWPGDIWSFTTDDGSCGDPNPARGATGVSPDATLSWTPGTWTANVFQVYLGTDEDAVNDANTSTTGIYQGVRNVNNFTPLNGLDLSKKYYWRIDDVNTAHPNSPFKGRIWNFTVGEKSLDDFEAYVDTEDLSNVWTDGWYGNNGATVYLAQKSEGDWVQGNDGVQAMKYTFDNDWDENHAYYSEAFRLTPNNLRDWATSGIKSIQLWFRGLTSNVLEPNIYVAIANASDSNMSMVTYSNYSDINDFKNGRWFSWIIPVADFTNTNLSDVRKIYIGIGERGNTTTPGPAVGTMYVDNISLLPLKCLTQQESPLAYNTPSGWDCDVNNRDLSAMHEDWLESEQTITAVNPTDSNLIAYYKFNDVNGGHWAHDEVASHDANIRDDRTDLWSTGGYDGNCLDFGVAGANGLSIPNDVFKIVGKPVDKQFSISVWVNGKYSGTGPVETGQPPSETQYLAIGPVGGDFSTRLQIILPSADYTSTFWTSAGSTSWNTMPPSAHEGSWNHFAFVMDGAAGYARIYHNGRLVAEGDAINASLAELKLGEEVRVAESGTQSRYKGKLDELQLYNKALSQAEVVYLAKGTGSHDIALAEPAVPSNMYSNVSESTDIINFRDFAKMAEKWLQQILYP